MTPLERAAQAAEEEIGKVEMVEAAPAVIRKLQAKRVARAVLAALREPSDAMVGAGAIGSGEDSDDVALGAWQAMIDAALAEGATD